MRIFTKSTRKLLIFIFTITFMLSCFSAFLTTLKWVKADSVSEAFYLGSDYQTKGLWYKGEKGTKEFAQNRVYGKDGIVIALGNATEGGQPFTDPVQLNDWSEESIANYVEYPSYVSEVTGDIVGLGDAPHGYFIDNFATIDEYKSGTYYDDWRLLPIDPDVYGFMQTAVWFSVEDMNFTVKVTDDEWHKVSVYVGYHYGRDDYAESLVQVLDLNGNVLAEQLVVNSNEYATVSFAVKGSYTLRMACPKGMKCVAFQAIYFDEVSSEQLNATDFIATLEGSKQINLSWQNSDESVATSIYRREKGESVWQNIGFVEAGTNTYTDKTSLVAKTYEYMLGLSKKRAYEDADNYYGLSYATFNAYDYLLPNSADVVEIDTAKYKKTSILFDDSSYLCENIDETLYAEVKLTRWDDDTNAMVPYGGREVSFSLSGEYVFDVYGGNKYQNMQIDLGKSITSPEGVALLTFKPEYPGEYIITASVAELPNEDDIMTGYDSCSTTSGVIVNEYVKTDVPYLLSITDAVKPGNTVTITGGFLGEGNVCEIAYAPSNGEISPVYDENINDIKYLLEDDLLVLDDMWNTGIMFVFPESESCGVYDFWVKNGYGWSKGITMNAVRSLYISENGGYECTPIEIVGRNYYGTEYGLSESSIEDIRIKLVRIGDLSGNSDGNFFEITVPIEKGIRYTAEESVTGEVIYESNPYKLTFKVPNVNENYGTYDVYVASNGQHFRKLENQQTLKIYQKKTADVANTIFGTATSNYNGNDPLKLDVWWAQNFNYSIVQTVGSQYCSNVDDFTAFGGYAKSVEATNAVQSMIDNMSNAGGGVLYFPGGYYYLRSIILRNNVILLGESKDETIVQCTINPATDYYFNFISGSNIHHVGISGMTLTLQGMQNYMTPDMFFNINADYFFIKNVKIDLPRPEEFLSRNTKRGLGMYGGTHLIYQDVDATTDYTQLNCSGVTDYLRVRNVNILMNGNNCETHARYSFIENTSLISGYRAHGWSGRSEVYFANNYVANVGMRENADNRGEIIMFEPPDGQLSRGYILSSTYHTFTVAHSGGVRIDESIFSGSNKIRQYNYFAVQIVDGRGTGQLRYFECKSINNENGNNWGNTYTLCDWEDDWDILPDSTSVYSVFLPMTGQTVYANKAERCAKSILIFSQCSDAVVVENDLNETEGIGIWSNGAWDAVGTNMHIRIERNSVAGISSGTGKGGIWVTTTRSTGNEYTGNIGLNFTIRNNYVKDCYNATGEYGSSETTRRHGIVVQTSTSTGQIPGDNRMIIIEGNTVENCEFGVWCDNRVYGVVVRDNNFIDIHNENITIYAPAQFFAYSNYTFVTDAGISGGEYAWNSELPKLENGDMAFYGWSYEENGINNTITHADGNSGTLYAVYGYSIVTDYNYVKSDGTSKGEYKSYVILPGEQIGNLGRPVRVGYTFGGWYYDEACTQEYNPNAQVNQNLKLYAKWISKNGDKPSDSISSNTNDNAELGWVIPTIVGLVALATVGGVMTLFLYKKKHKR